MMVRGLTSGLCSCLVQPMRAAGMVGVSGSLVILLVCLTVTEAQPYQQDRTSMGTLKESRSGITALKRVVHDIDNDLRRDQKRSCAVGGGMSKHCHAERLDSQLHLLDWLTDADSPGKRSLPRIPRATARNQAPSSEHDRRDWQLPCHVGGGMSGYRCHLQTVSASGRARNWLGSSAMSPGKRSGAPSYRHIQPITAFTLDHVGGTLQRQLSEMSRKRKGLQILERILNEMEADLIKEQKRACQINLGGHCATESAAAVADQWHYLNSPLSPGRKRRDTGLFKKLISGEILH